MTPTYWLIAGLIVFLLMCLLAVFFGHCISTDWNDADQPFYRTADSGVLSADACAALRQASKFDAPAPTAINANTQTTRREGTAAAIRDLGRKPGTPATANPHASDTLPHFMWRDAYDRASTVHVFKAAP